MALNVCVERNCLSSGGSLFHARGAATQNALSPNFPPRLRNDLYCVEWDVKLYYTIPSELPIGPWHDEIATACRSEGG